MVKPPPAERERLRTALPIRSASYLPGERRHGDETGRTGMSMAMQRLVGNAATRQILTGRSRTAEGGPARTPANGRLHTSATPPFSEELPLLPSAPQPPAPSGLIEESGEGEQVPVEEALLSLPESANAVSPSPRSSPPPHSSPSLPAEAAASPQGPAPEPNSELLLNAAQAPEPEEALPSEAAAALPAEAAEVAAEPKAEAGAPEAGAAPPSGPPSGAEAPAAPEGGEAEAAPAVKPHIDSSSSQALLQSLAGVPPSASGEAMKMAYAALPDIQGREKSEMEASFPEVERPSGLPRRGGKMPPEASKLEKGSAPPSAAPAGRQGEPPETVHPEPRQPLPGQAVSTAAAEPAEEKVSWWDWLVNKVRSFLARLPTQDPSVSTSAGERPRVDMSGDADPAQNEATQRTSDREMADRHAGADRATYADFGENEIYPADVPEEILRPSYKPTAPEGAKGAGEGLPALSAEARQSLDRTAAPWLQGKVGEKIAQERLDQAELQSKSQEVRQEGQLRIAQETEQARLDQQGLRQAARDEVAGERERWRQENQQIEQEYSTKSQAKRLEIDRQIQQEVQTAEQKADQELTKAEQKADAEKAKAEAKAAAEKKKAKKKKRSWWDRVKGAVSSAFEAIKSAVNAIFDAMRKLVKQIIEAAKKLVRGIIEAARRAVVGLIKGFGEFLKGLVTIALAAFPEAAAKARAWIDRRVDTAVEAVNQAAEALKKATDAILDWVGSALDFALSLYQKAYNLLLDGLKFLVVGLMELMEKIGYLVSAARQMPDHFWGQAQEEVIGMNLNEPLPFERTRPVSVEGAAEAALESEAITSQDRNLLHKGQLAGHEVEVDQVAALDQVPEFILAFDLEEGQEIEFGESPDPNRSIAAVKEELLGRAPAAPQQAGESPQAGSAGPVSQMTPEQELQELMSQQPQGGCTKEKAGEPSKGEGVPEHLKKGPFTPGQRGRYLWHQIKQGVSQWFECNWPWLLAAAVGALLGFIALNILTGGAVLAALPALMQIVGAIMIGVAIARVTAYVGQYLSQGWQGNIAEAAKSLARGLAIGAIELIFALLFNLGAVIKSMKAGLKASLKAAGKAAKATVTTTLKSVRKLGQLGLEGSKAALRNGKLIFQGVRRGAIQGAKSLDDLARRLWRRLRFRKFKIRRRGLLFQLFGYINPWILLASGELKQVKRTDISGSKAAGSLAKYKGPAGARFDEFVDALVLGSKSGEEYAKIFRKLADDGVVPALIKKNLNAKEVKWLLDRFREADDEAKEILLLLIKDTQTPWKLLKKTADATRKGKKIDWRQVSGKLRGMSGEVATVLAAKEGKLMLAGKPLTIVDSQVRTAAGRVLDFAVTTVDDAGNKLLMEVKAWTRDSWDKVLKAYAKEIGKGGPLSEEARRFARLVDQLKDGASATGNKVLLTVTDNMTGAQIRMLKRLLAKEGVPFELVKLSNKEVIRVSQEIKSALKMTKGAQK